MFNNIKVNDFNFEADGKSYALKNMLFKSDTTKKAG